MGLFNVLMTEFIVACVTGYYFSPIHIPFLLPPYPLPLSTPATQAKFIVVTGRKDGVDLVLIYRHVVIFIARFVMVTGLSGVQFGLLYYYMRNFCNLIGLEQYFSLI